MAHISYKMNTGGKKALSGKKIKILQWFTAKKNPNGRKRN